MHEKTILITGAGGMLAHALIPVLEAAGARVLAYDRSALDVTDRAAVRAAISARRPEIVIQCAAYTRVDDAENDEDRAFAVNAAATRYVAEACNAVGAKLVYPSTDYVFDGAARKPYKPADAPNPINVYGRSKLAGEAAAREAAHHLVVRSSWLYGAHGRNFVRTIAEKLARGDTLRVVADQRGAPTWTSDLSAAIVALLQSPASPALCHATNTGVASWHELACAVASQLGYHAEIEPVTTAEVGARAARPAYSVLDCSAAERITGALRDWRSALAQAIRMRQY